MSATTPPKKIYPFLNWRELDRFCALVGPKIEGSYIERVIVPDRSRFPLGFLKGEWALRIESKKEAHVLLCSVRAQRPSLHYLAGKGPRAAPEGTHSPFDLALSKQIRGARILSFSPLPRERMAILWLTAEGRSPETERLALLFKLIPAQPEALLMKVRGPFTPGKLPAGPWPIVARSRTVRSEGADLFHLPDTSRSPPELPLRPELLGPQFDDLKHHSHLLEATLSDEAWEQRVLESQRRFRELFQNADTRARQATLSQQEALREPEWGLYGDLLKALLHSPPPIVWKGIAEQGGAKPIRLVTNWNTGEEIELPCDPKISDARTQTEKFYSLARRKSRRLEESHTRAQTFTEQATRYQNRLTNPPVAFDWKSLEEYEREAGILRKLAQADAAAGKKVHGKSAFSARAWSGKTFVSRDGYPIWVGKTKDENLELTFKHARGNDIWMHVKGKPGAHVVVPVPSGKSASLETLLDAAQLTLFYSGGQAWGKTEIDYTFKKNVKRIRDSSEASYTQNKTLVVQNEAARIQRLLEQIP